MLQTIGSREQDFIEILKDFEKRLKVFSKIATTLFLGLILILFMQLLTIVWLITNFK